MEREVEGGIGMGNTCKPIAVSFQCMTKSTTNKKRKKKKRMLEQATISYYKDKIYLFIYFYPFIMVTHYE